jgi:hypothetical protein
MANHGLEQTAHRLRQDIRKEKRAFVSRSRVPPLIPTVLRKVSYDSYSPRQRRTLAVRCKRFGFPKRVSISTRFSSRKHKVMSGVLLP